MTKSYKEDGRPAIQFYVDDWLSEPGLNICSLAAQGLWIKMICYMFKSDFRGCLQANGKKITSKQLAKLAGEPEETIKDLLAELMEKEVYSTLDNGTIYNRRMYNQTIKEREIREVRAKAGRKGGQAKGKQTLKKELSKKEAKTPATSSSSTSSSTSKKEINTLRDIKSRHKSPISKKPTNPDIKKFIDWWFERFKKEVGEKYHVTGKDAKVVQGLLNTYSYEGLVKAGEYFWEHRDEFVSRAGHTVGVFSSKINPIIEKAKKEMRQ